MGSNLPGSPMIKTLHFHCRGMGSIPGGGTKIPHAMKHGQKTKTKKWAKDLNIFLQDDTKTDNRFPKIILSITTTKQMQIKNHNKIPLHIQKIPWRRKWQLTPVFLPGKFHGQRSLVGYSPGGHQKSDMT